MHLESESHTMEIESEWMKQAKTIQKILEQGFENFAAGISDIEKAFDGGEPTLCCMDEGTPMGDMRSAGSGILTSGEERQIFLAKLKASGLKDVTSNAGCGAASLYRERNNITDKTVDEVAIEEAKRVAQELGVPYKGHITELKRPTGFHNSRVVYVDGTGRFNPSKVSYLPQGFVVSRKYMSAQQALSEAWLAAKIAFGEHGFGKKFTQEKPFIVIAIGEESGDLTATKISDELRGFLDLEAAPEIDASRVKINSFNIPRRAEIPFEQAA